MTFSTAWPAGMPSQYGRTWMEMKSTASTSSGYFEPDVVDFTGCQRDLAAGLGADLADHVHEAGDRHLLLRVLVVAGKDREGAGDDHPPCERDPQGPRRDGRQGSQVRPAKSTTYGSSIPELVDAVDFISIHVLPYWEGVRTRRLGRCHRHARQDQAAYPNKRIKIGEFGWPSAGYNRHAAMPGRIDQADDPAGICGSRRAAKSLSKAVSVRTGASSGPIASPSSIGSARSVNWLLRRRSGSLGAGSCSARASAGPGVVSAD